jgi:hypothetical protein
MNLADFFAGDGPLAAVLGNGYQKRDQQVNMARVALGIIQQGGAAALLGDAKTGTGKSLGSSSRSPYPAGVLWCRRRRRHCNTSCYAKNCRLWPPR